MKHKKVFTSFFLCFGILALCAPGISKDKIFESIWAATPLKIDGSNSDWEGSALTLENKVKVDYAFRNDSENLYVLFIFKEPREYMSTINYTGMTLWLNVEGKKKKNYGIKFQIKTVTADNYISILEKMMGPMPEEKKKEIKSKPTYRIYHNEVIDKEGAASLIATGPSAPSFSSRGREMVTYEFRIPLKRGEGQPVGIGTEPGKTIKIGFEWGGMTEDLKKQRLAEQTERGTTGTSGGATTRATDERDRVGGDTGSMSSIRRGAKKHSFWADVKLAQSR